MAIYLLRTLGHVSQFNRKEDILFQGNVRLHHLKRLLPATWSESHTQFRREHPPKDKRLPFQRMEAIALLPFVMTPPWLILEWRTVHAAWTLPIAPGHLLQSFFKTIITNIWAYIQMLTAVNIFSSKKWLQRALRWRLPRACIRNLKQASRATHWVSTSKPQTRKESTIAWLLLELFDQHREQRIILKGKSKNCCYQGASNDQLSFLKMFSIHFLKKKMHYVVSAFWQCCRQCCRKCCRP